MALRAAAASLASPSVSAAKFSMRPGEARLGLSNGAGISAFGGESAAPGRPQCSGTRSRRESASALRSGGSESWGSAIVLRSRSGAGPPSRSMQETVSVRAAVENEFNPAEVVKSKGMTYEGPGKGGQWLSCTTRHVRIYIGVADPETKALDQTQLDKVTLMLDPDNEFLWPEDKAQKVYDYFAELVEAYAGAPMTEYTLRLIGSDLEHFIRKMLLGNEIKYNLDCRVLNFSMGKPRYESGIVEVGED